jgi:hypothetical protein
VSSVYREVAAPGSTFSNSAQFFLESARANGIRYIDLSSIFPDNKFGDPDHLLQESAAEFSEMATNACFGNAGGMS